MYIFYREEDTSGDVVEKINEVLNKVLDRIIKFLDDKKVIADEKIDTLVEQVISTILDYQIPRNIYFTI